MSVLVSCKETGELRVIDFHQVENFNLAFKETGVYRSLCKSSLLYSFDNVNKFKIWEYKDVRSEAPVLFKTKRVGKVIKTTYTVMSFGVINHYEVYMGSEIELLKMKVKLKRKKEKELLNLSTNAKAFKANYKKLKFVVEEKNPITETKTLTTKTGKEYTKYTFFK